MRLSAAVLVLLTAALPAEELAALLAKTAPAPAFAGRTPVFTATTRAFSFVSPKGPETVVMTLIHDGDRLVGVYDPRMAQLDLITHPDDAVKDPVWPTRYHWAHCFGTRASLGLWYDGQYISSQKNGLEVSGGGRTITLTFTEQWTRKRKADSVCTAVIALDPVLGYTATLDFRLSTDDARKRTIEFSNTMPGQMSCPWPERGRYDRTVLTPKGGGLVGWANNAAAADKSDRKGLTIRDGGFIAWLPGAGDRSRGRGVVLSYLASNGSGSSQTCNVWQDQHVSFSLPEKPDADGRFRINATLRLSGLPPETAAELGRTAAFDAFDGATLAMIRVGRVDDLEDQPLPLTTTQRVLWGEAWTISTEQAHSGSRSIVVSAADPAKPLGLNGFVTSPQIDLDANTRYRMAAWVYVEGAPGTEAWLGGSFYEYSPHDATRLGEVATNRAAAGAGWTRVEMVFTASELGPFLDFRLRCQGSGRAWFDDIELRRE
jgi:hypothetical protein